MITLNLNPDIEARLHAQAQASGMSLEDLVLSMLYDL
jgi:predicted HicB family RNase H-like nuclease